MSFLIDRLPLTEIPLEVRAGLDAQGMPSYAPPVIIESAPVWEDSVVMGKDGSQVKSVLTVYLPTSAPEVKLDDRLNVGGFAVIVIAVSSPRGLQTWKLDHAMLKCRLE